jgi:hypothetical protein
MSQQFDHRTAAVNGINIHYVIEGRGFPVVLLLGWPETWLSWRKQIPVLAERRLSMPALYLWGERQGRTTTAAGLETRWSLGKRPGPTSGPSTLPEAGTFSMKRSPKRCPGSY